ncbi:hypothetical protein BgiBS90_021038, partial [Biomphalaria glabrata]
ETDVLQIVYNLHFRVQEQSERLISLQQKLSDRKRLEHCMQTLKEDKSDLARQIEDWGNYLKSELAEEKKVQEAK